MHFTVTGARKIVRYTGVSVPKGVFYLYGEYLKAREFILTQNSDKRRFPSLSSGVNGHA